MARARENAQGARDVLADVGGAVVSLERAIERYAEDDVLLLSFTVQTPYKGRDGYLCIARIQSGGERFVAFSGGDTVYECLKSFATRFSNKQLDLKEDRYEQG